MRLNLPRRPDEKRIVNVERLGQKRAEYRGHRQRQRVKYGCAANQPRVLSHQVLPEGEVGAAMRVLFSRVRRR